MLPACYLSYFLLGFQTPTRPQKVAKRYGIFVWVIRTEGQMYMGTQESPLFKGINIRDGQNLLLQCCSNLKELFWKRPFRIVNCGWKSPFRFQASYSELRTFCALLIKSAECFIIIRHDRNFSFLFQGRASHWLSQSSQILHK